MSREIIEINKSLIPYEFNIILANELFTLSVDYNNAGGFFTLGLAKDGETLCSGAPIIYGRPIFEDVRKPTFPKVDIVPLDLSGENNAVTYDNLGTSVLLILDDGKTPISGG